MPETRAMTAADQATLAALQEQATSESALEPSPRRARTGIRRLFLIRTSIWAPLVLMALSRSATSKPRSASNSMPGRRLRKSFGA